MARRGFGFGSVLRTLAALGGGIATIYKMFNFGSGKSIEVADHASLDLTNDFSGCAWVYPNNRTVNQWVISKYASLGDNISWLMYITSSGELAFIHSTNGLATTSFISTISVPLGTLSLIHFRLTAGTLYLGIDDEAEEVTAKGACFSGTAQIEIGRVDGSIYSDDFDISQSMLFNSGSSLANFATIYNDGDPLAFERLKVIDSDITDAAVMAINQSSYDNSLVDLSGNSNDGTALGGVIPDGSEITWET